MAMLTPYDFWAGIYVRATIVFQLSTIRLSFLVLASMRTLDISLCERLDYAIASFA